MLSCSYDSSLCSLMHTCGCASVHVWASVHVCVSRFRWVNRKDKEGEGLFEGGFLGLDNISVFDRSHAKHVR